MNIRFATFATGFIAMRYRSAVIMLTAIMMLTGCSASNIDGLSTEDSVATQSPYEVSDVPTATADDVQSAFLKDVRASSRILQESSDQQLLAYAIEACERLDRGEKAQDISVIADETRSASGRFEDSASIVAAAALHLCST